MKYTTLIESKSYMILYLYRGMDTCMWDIIELSGFKSRSPTRVFRELSISSRD